MKTIVTAVVAVFLLAGFVSQGNCSPVLNVSLSTTTPQSDPIVSGTLGSLLAAWEVTVPEAEGIGDFEVKTILLLTGSVLIGNLTLTAGSGETPVGSFETPRIINDFAFHWEVPAGAPETFSLRGDAVGEGTVQVLIPTNDVTGRGTLGTTYSAPAADLFGGVHQVAADAVGEAPEPASLILVGVGVFGILVGRLKSKRK